MTLIFDMPVAADASQGLKKHLVYITSVAGLRAPDILQEGT